MGVRVWGLGFGVYKGAPQPWNGSFAYRNITFFRPKLMVSLLKKKVMFSSSNRGVVLVILTLINNVIFCVRNGSLARYI